MPRGNGAGPNQAASPLSLGRGPAEQAQEPAQGAVEVPTKPATAIPDHQRFEEIIEVDEDGPQHAPTKNVIDDIAVEKAHPSQVEQETVEKVNELPVPASSQARPKRNAKPNPRYEPEVFDLNYVAGKPRIRSRRSVKRAGN